ncbi:MAG: hypothetical protein EYC70_16040 [Planctomycetota bacterium]|nr:MAG: hypothetical protein EYC70_16040 [Planctomycetota bacterium]
MEARPAVSWRVLLAALLLGAVPAVAAALLPQDTRRPLLQPLDLPLTAAALGFGGACALLGPRAQRPIRFVLPAALGLAVLPVALQALLLDTPISSDERAYLLQAQLFAEGRLSEPLAEPACRPEDKMKLCPLHQRQVYEDTARGVRYAKYSPGASLALAPGTAAGAPWLAPALLALADVLLLHAIARRMRVQAPLAAPLAAPLLLAASPFFFLVHASYQSEVFTLPAALAGYWCLLCAREQQASGARRFLSGLGIGASAGWIFCIRPLTGVLFAAACVPGLMWKTERRSFGALAGAFAGGIPLLLLALGYNAVQTGDLLSFPYHRYAVEFGPWLDPAGTIPLDVYGRGALLDGLLDHAARWSVGTGVLGLAALGFLGLWRLRAHDGGSALALAVLLPVAYAAHWYRGHWAYLGPLYAFESLGLLLLGVQATAAAAPPRWRSGIYGALAAGAVLLGGYRLGIVREQSALCHAPEAAAAAAPAGSVVLLPFFRDPERQNDSLKYYTPSRPPFDPDETVLVRELQGPRRTQDALAQLGLGGRPVFRFVPDGSSGGHLEPYAP